MKNARSYKLAENAVAISAVFHSSKRYEKFYNKLGESFSGFPGIWALVSRAAQQFTSVEVSLTKEMRADVWSNHEWIDAVDLFAAYLLDAGLAGETLTDAQMRVLADKAIRKS